MGFLRKNLGLGKEVLIKKWLEVHRITEYDIDDDFRITSYMTTTYINISGNLPEYIDFKRANNFYFAGDEKTTSLIGCPEYISGSFMILQCKNLKNLNGCPKEVRGGFYAQNNGIETIEPYPAFPQEAANIYLFGNPVAINLIGKKEETQKMVRYVHDICNTYKIFLT